MGQASLPLNQPDTSHGLSTDMKHVPEHKDKLHLERDPVWGLHSRKRQKAGRVWAVSMRMSQQVKPLGDD